MRVILRFSWLASFIAASAAYQCDINSIKQILANETSTNVTFVQRLGQNSTFGGGAADLPYPNNSTGLPPLCVVTVNVKSSPTSSYNFGLFLPDDWNHRFIATGNGGFAGGINWNDAATNVKYGFASVSTDTGHISIGFDGDWALNHPEAQYDWGYRAIHGSTVLAKVITRGYYGAEITYSYYTGCSTGGRQGFRDIQQYPEDFDGILAGAPAWWQTHLNPWAIQLARLNLPVNASHHIPSSLFPVIGAEVLRQCDPQDGLTDGIISDPSRCRFVPETLLCGPKSNTSRCLTGPQINTLYNFYNDWYDVNQTFVFPNYKLGAEAQYGNKLNVDSGVPALAGTSWIQNFLYNDTNWDFHNFSYATVQDADRINPANGNVNFNISAFQKRGGKIIHYHGLADGIITAGSSEVLYRGIWKTLGATGVGLDDWYRLFLIPGMQHCSGTPVNAPYFIGGAGQAFALGSSVWSVPGYSDAKHDALLALLAWREQGIAPDQIIGTKFRNESVAAGVLRQRPICAFPNRAAYNGTGNPDLAESWRCEPLY